MTGTRRSRAAHVAAALSVVVCFGTSGPPAHAEGPVTDGLLCGASEMLDPSPQRGTMRVEVDGGPVLLTEADGVTPARGTLVCRIVVSEHWNAHLDAGTDVAGRGTGVLTAGPAVVRVASDWWGDVFLCTQFVDDRGGVTYYWNDWPGEWSTDPAVPCAVYDVSEPDDGLELLVDSIVCPFFALLFPPEGDVPSVWDCPPYGNREPLPYNLGCADGLDDDADGLADYPADPGCASADDPDEHSFAACDDGADSDGDRTTDYPHDPGCASAADTDERGSAACDDGVDNDGDGSRDYVLDPGCDSPADGSETA